ncbi:MAG: TolC family protein [Cyanobacteria bacterium P01_C01_bin.72]
MSIYAYLLTLNSHSVAPQFDYLQTDFTIAKSEYISPGQSQATAFSSFKYKQVNLKPNFSVLNNAIFDADLLLKPQANDNLVNNIPTKESATEVSLGLAPNSDPLFLPTNPEQVKVNDLTPLTLKQAIEIANNNNRQLKITRLDLKSNEAALKAEKSAWFPILSVQTTLDRSETPTGEIRANAQRDLIREQVAAIPSLESQLAQSDNPLEQQQLLAQIQQAEAGRNQLNSIKNFASTQINGSVGLQFTAFSDQRSATIKIAQEEVNFSRLEVERIEKDLRLQVTNAYYDLQQSDRQVEIAENDVDSRRKGVKVVERLMKAALATRLDLLNAQVELDNALQILRNTEAQRLTARRNIAQILSLSEKVTPVTADQVTLGDRWDLTLEETIILALDNRVELEQQLAQRRLGKARVRSAWAGIKPEVGLFANYDFAQLYSDEPGDSALRGFGDGYSVGINFNWTIWDGGGATARAKQARAITRIAEEQFADNVNQIRFEVEQAYYQLPALIKNVATADQAVDKAEAAVSAATRRFKANLNTQTEVLDAQNRLIQARNNQIQSILDYNRAFAALERAIGGKNNSVKS